MSPKPAPGILISILIIFNAVKLIGALGAASGTFYEAKAPRCPGMATDQCAYMFTYATLLVILEFS